MFFGWLTLVALSAIAFLASLSVCVRAGYESRSERTVAAFGLWQAIIVFPFLALGWAGRLTPATLGASVLFVSVAALTLSFPRGGARAHFQLLRSSLWQAIRIPFDALWWARRSFALVALLATLGCLIWTAWLS